jgi:hypothetical protein
MQGAPFELGFHAITDRGTVQYHYSPASFALHGLHGEGAETGPAAASLKLYPVGGEPVDLYTPQRDSFEVAIDGEIEAFVSAIVEGREPPIPGEEARRSLAISLCSLESCETGEIVISSL